MLAVNLRSDCFCSVCGDQVDLVRENQITKKVRIVMIFWISVYTRGAKLFEERATLA